MIALALITSFGAGTVAYMWGVPMWLSLLVGIAAIIVFGAVLPQTRSLLFNRRQRRVGEQLATAEVAQAASAPQTPSPDGRLQFGELAHQRIGPVIGEVAYLLEIHAAAAGLDWQCQNLRAELIFSHAHSQQVVHLPGWFVSSGDEAIFEPPREIVPLLDSSRRTAPNQCWLILYVCDATGSEFHRFVGPAPADSPVSDWALTLDASSHLEYGEWDVTIVMTGDGLEKAVRELRIQCL